MLNMIHLNHYYNRIFTKQGIELKVTYCLFFYLKTVCIGNQHDLGSCILDVLLSDRGYI